MVPPRSTANNRKDSPMPSVLITGTSSGIGMAIALAFGRAGYRVYATMRDLSRGSQLRRIVEQEKLPVALSAMDVDSDSSVKEAIGRITREAGPIDVLVNNAGAAPTGSVQEAPLSLFRSTMETNYFGVIRCVQAVLPAMRERRSGCIINISSVAGRIAMSPMAPYNATKFALEGLTESLAQEVKPFNIRVALVQPGIIDTPMARQIADGQSRSAYPQSHRISAFFTAALQIPRPPSLVGDKVLEIVESGTWQLRHPVGPDAAPFLGWRQSMNDEEWVAWGALDDDAWYDRVKADFGIDARPWSRTAEMPAV
jgi:NAD(P)-dependent dehydrogenase (short-subunit alcohol dehydrogenase family)